MKDSCTFRYFGYNGRVIRKEGIGGCHTINNDRDSSLTIYADRELDYDALMRMAEHELYEAGMILLGCKMVSANPNNYQSYFIMDHMQLTTLCEEIHSARNEILRGIE